MNQVEEKWHLNNIDVKDREALYSQQKQDWEQAVAQNMNSLLPNSDDLKIFILRCGQTKEVLDG